jgi:Uncharacterized integral membrane protein (DUF2301)
MRHSVYHCSVSTAAGHPSPLRVCRWVPPNGQRALLVTFMALFSIFAARKYTQPVKDDLGDKSVRGLSSVAYCMSC